VLKICQNVYSGVYSVNLKSNEIKNN